MIIKLYNGRVKLLYGTRWAVCGPCTRSTPPHNGMRRPTTRDVPRQDDRELRSIKNILNRIVECFATGRGIEPGLVSITDRQQRPFPGYEFLPFSYYESWLNFYRWYPRKMRIIMIDFKVETLNTTIQRDKDNIPQSSILSEIFKRNIWSIRFTIFTSWLKFTISVRNLHEESCYNKRVRCSRTIRRNRS